jgi:hypothetical protein
LNSRNFPRPWSYHIELVFLSRRANVRFWRKADIQAFGGISAFNGDDARLGFIVVIPEMHVAANAPQPTKFCALICALTGQIDPKTVSGVNVGL